MEQLCENCSEPLIYSVESKEAFELKLAIVSALGICNFEKPFFLFCH